MTRYDRINSKIDKLYAIRENTFDEVLVQDIDQTINDLDLILDTMIAGENA